jgi:hypothetical protein
VRSHFPKAWRKRHKPCREIESYFRVIGKQPETPLLPGERVRLEHGQPGAKNDLNRITCEVVVPKCHRIAKHAERTSKTFSSELL